MLLYLHIPFCESKCGYCAFASESGHGALYGPYMRAVLRQFWQEIDRKHQERHCFETLYIGGGTPSCLPVKYYEPFFEAVMPYLRHDAEITVEANPNSVDKSWLGVMKSMGVNRVSFGVQSFDREKLRYLGRIHSPSQAVDATCMAGDVGIEHISLDLMYGTECDSVNLLENDLKQAFDLPIDHMSLYCLMIEEDTVFSEKKRKGRESDTQRTLLVESLESRGFIQYEVANFGKYRSVHNRGYWRYLPYIGLGAGAVGFDGHFRYYSHREIGAYIRDPLGGMTERLNENDRKTEKILLGLRSDVGFDPSLLNAREQERLDILLSHEKVFQKEAWIVNRDFFLADEIALFLLGGS